MKDDPFVVLDQPGVGQLVEMGVKKGRSARPSLKIGICGEHGGDPRSIAFCERVGFDYVSCSPFRVPVARLADPAVMLGAAEAKVADLMPVAAGRQIRLGALALLELLITVRIELNI